MNPAGKFSGQSKFRFSETGFDLPADFQFNATRISKRVIEE
jgi:hypothetical protein